MIPTVLLAATASDGVTSTVAPTPDALRLDYDFAIVSGYAVTRRPLAID